MTSDLQVVHTLETEQLQRQEKARQRAEAAHLSAQRRLKDHGHESALSHGQQLFQLHAGALAQSLAASLEAFAANPGRAVPHAKAFPFFNRFKGPEHIATVALVACLDQLSRKQRHATFCQNLGAQIEKEDRLIRAQQQSPIVLRHLFREGTARQRIASEQTMKRLGVPVLKWGDQARLAVGMLLLDHIGTVTNLVVVRKHRVGRTTPRFVHPSAEAEEFIRQCPLSSYQVPQTAMVCPPRPWAGLFGGGHLENEDCLVRVPVQDIEEKHTTAIEHLRQADLSRIYAAVNHLQSSALHVDAEMVELQRAAWENGIDGLFPCARAPQEPPARLGSDPSVDELRARNRIAQMAHRDREKNRHNRIRIERTLQLAEGLAGRTIWQSYHLDHRGRAYTGNKYVTHQGPDAEKALLRFEEEKPVDDEAFQWMLKAAAGHYGLSRNTWAERLSWGKQNLARMLAAAEDPLGQRELWRSAKDPWQFLQAARAIRDVHLHGKGSGVPVRLDQTTSGCGILSALIRDRHVGRLCNLWGQNPRDLYTVVAEAVTKALMSDLQTPGDDTEAAKKRGLAELWLQMGISRGLVKGPILATPYGGSYQSLTDSLVDALDAHLGFVPIEEFAYRVAVPSRYLASHVWRELKGEVQPCIEVKAWLRKVCQIVLGSGQPLEWTTSMGFPMRLADREPTVSRVTSMLFGTKIHLNIADQPVDAPLSATMASKGIGANFVHGIDAAFLTQVTYGAASIGLPLLTNHDCFGAMPADAGTLHGLLHDTLRGFYAVDWLAVTRAEIESRTGLKLPAPPMVGTLCPGEIGQNPYCFS
jgi:DNA-directed RNA polymerase